ncbi:diphthamide biosynthesis protein [Staphylothermus marinus F1]|uniref:2-(3-amino-3-carboxypropyl)histidine synthase n=1 Tax=Staphylothermus marinus (strain ATCC 43588 / DSM 3639 / JCM 9404 / F1) TaxID=399550 RepID=A3DM77_STAMF|nr:diphthamide biosynthesis enzyme Dph2 [Staphylothermus marinus]ABN69737.1 diphthamide biosynthesis protein [Staphylothermus marinus F1]
MSESFCESYEVDYQALINIIREKNASRIFIQAPDGLKKLYRCIGEYITDKLSDIKIYYSASPSFGACDIPLEEIEAVKPDLIIHIGHNKYPFLSRKINYDIIYLPAYYKWKPTNNIINMLINEFKKYNVKRIGLVASIQHVHSLEEVAEKLEEHGYIAYIEKPAYNVMMPGQILGCEYSAALRIYSKVDLYLVVAGGIFHALGLSLIVDKPVIILDPYRLQVINPSSYIKRLKAKRYYVLSKLRNELIRNAGIIIGSRPGQYRPTLIKYIEKLLEEHGIKYYLFTSTYLSREQLISIDNSYNLDLYIITSCPRLPIDDFNDFYKPVITPGELIMVLKNIVEKYVYPW